MSYTAVIGANFGDEGKGHIVDYLASKDSLVVRFNGGAQAGHTVVAPNGLRHVFSHFGSGSLKGAATYLSEHFLVNPLLWKKELLELETKGVVPTQLFVHPEALVTTPFDMLVNQEVERARGNDRHGSCGVGINETVTRSENPRLRLTVERLSRIDMTKTDPFFEALRGYALGRFAALTGVVPPKLLVDRLYSSSILDAFLTQVGEFFEYATVHDPFGEYKDVVFEGAQGLLLDEKHKFFPYVTRSRTGLTNLESLRLRNKALRVIFVTRAYMTRHGKGPFPTEHRQLPDGIYDDTNARNEFQGELRIGSLDFPLMRDTLLEALHVNIRNVASELAVTCLDQVAGSQEVLKDIRTWIPVPVRLESYDSSRAGIQEVE